MQQATRMDSLAGGLPMGSDPASVLRRVELLERLLERSFVIPGVNRPVGLDAIAGLVPVAGDALTAVMGIYLIWEARNLKMSRWQMVRMSGNVAVDTLLGMVPFAGDLFDFVFRSNSRNLKIIRRHIERHHPHLRVIDQ